MWPIYIDVRNGCYIKYVSYMEKKEHISPGFQTTGKRATLACKI
jgi:hypothetical protein